MILIMYHSIIVTLKVTRVVTYNLSILLLSSSIEAIKGYSSRIQTFNSKLSGLLKIQ